MCPEQRLRRTCAVKKALDWRDIGDANVNPDFLYPEADDSPCPISITTRMPSQEDAKKYMQWIQHRVPNIEKKDERAYCGYCDMTSKILTQPLLQAPEELEREALTHALRGQSSTFSLFSGSGQQWHCQAQLGQA